MFESIIMHITFESQPLFWLPLERSRMGLVSNSTSVKSHQNNYSSYHDNGNDYDKEIMVGICKLVLLLIGIFWLAFAV